MLRIKVALLVLAGSSLISEYASSRLQWNILNYIEGDNNIAEYAWHNINEMKTVGSTNKINIMVQLDEPINKKTWRFQVLKKKLLEAGSIDVDMGKNPEKELKEAGLWAHTACPSDHTMVILWNHGNGILDEPKIHNQRGILYDFANHTFLNNQQLDAALGYIATTVLGKKIDIIGMDACLMSMVEVAYQIKEHAELFIASENLELAPGWHYAHFLETLNKTQEPLTPRTIALHIASSYALLNRNRTLFYTISTIDLSTMISLKNTINKVVTAVFDAHKEYPAQITTMVKQARNHSLEFEQGKYIDFYSFLNQFKNALNLSRQTHIAQFLRIKTALDECISQLSKSVIISRTGPAIPGGSGGLSIYFPRQPIHHSYEKTKFAHDTQWLSFITLFHP